MKVTEVGNTGKAGLQDTEASAPNFKTDTPEALGAESTAASGMALEAEGVAALDAVLAADESACSTPAT
ncbi:MAG TPA: hypothetical protein VGG18_11575 [Granulicella sp.]